MGPVSNIQTQKTISTNIVDRNQTIIKLKHRKILSLIDTGANVSLIRTNLANKLKLNYQQEPDAPRFLFGANNHRFELQGSVTMDVVIQGLPTYNFACGKRPRAPNHSRYRFPGPEYGGHRHTK